MENPAKDLTDKPEAEDFDPIGEIKRLRQDLAHRLQELQEREDDRPRSPIALKNTGSETGCVETPREINLDLVTRHMRQAKKMLAHLQVKTIAQGRASGESWPVAESPLPPEAIERKRKTILNEDASKERSPILPSRNQSETESESCGHCCATPRPVKPGKDFLWERLGRLEKMDGSFSSPPDFLGIANVGLTGLGSVLAVAGCFIFVFHGFSAGAILVSGGAAVLLVGLAGARSLRRGAG